MVAATELAAALDDHLYALDSGVDKPGESRFSKEPRAYLEDRASTESAYLRRFHPPGDGEVHYEAAPDVLRTCCHSMPIRSTKRSLSDTTCACMRRPLASVRAGQGLFPCGAGDGNRTRMTSLEGWRRRSH